MRPRRASPSGSLDDEQHGRSEHEPRDDRRRTAMVVLRAAVRRPTSPPSTLGIAKRLTQALHSGERVAIPPHARDGARPQGDGAGRVRDDRRDAQTDQRGEGDERAATGDGVDRAADDGGHEHECEAQRIRVDGGRDIGRGRKHAPIGASNPASHARGRRRCAVMPFGARLRYLSRGSEPRLDRSEGERGMTKTANPPVHQPSTDALEIRDHPHGQVVHGPDRRRRDPRDGPAADQGRRRRLRADELRPGVHEHRVVPQRDHVHRRRQGNPALPRLSRSSSSPRRRRFSRSRGCCATASCRRSSNTTSGCTTSRSTRTCTRTSSGSSRGSATTRIRCRCCAAAVAALSSFYPEAKNIHRPGAALHLDHPAAREGADAGRVLLPAREGPAVRLSRQRPLVRRELPVDGRAHVRSRSTRRIPMFVKAIEVLFILHADHEQNCSTNAVRAVGLVARRSVLAPSPPASRRCTARCTAARTSRCCA